MAATRAELQELIYEINDIIGNKRLKLAGKVEEIRELLDGSFEEGVGDDSEEETESE